MGDLIDIAVVTAVWGDYGKYLPEWADSILLQTVKPSQAVIIDRGMDDKQAARDAAKRLRSAGITVSTPRAKPHVGMGEAMNAAVERSSTDWVIRLDADDTLMPNAIEDVQNLSDVADVVSMGALRDGREVLFPQVSAEWILAGRQGSLAPSAFRRSFWERSPFHTMNDWIESAFWVGLAHLGARFVPTTRPGFVYRQHPGSHSHAISKDDKLAARQQHLELCREWR